MTTTEFIEKSKLTHGNRYDYSLVNYINSSTHVDIICKEHGVFKQTPNNHLLGKNCKRCAMIEVGNKNKSNSDSFIEKAKVVHDNKYDYSLVDYINNKTKIRIVCPTHGEFEQIPSNHLRGIDCPECGKIKTKIKVSKDLEYFIEKSNKIHNNKYDYSKSIYVNSKTKLTVICPIHGESQQTPEYHYSTLGCKECSKEHFSLLTRKSLNGFIQESISVHKYKYDYSQVNYINSSTKIKLICNICGHIFYQTPHTHLNGAGCPNCYKLSPSNNKSNLNEFIEKSIKFNGNRYNYSKSEYVDSKTRLKIICNDCGGEFLQTPSLILKGSNCPLCSDGISIPEKFMSNILIQLNIDFEREKVFSWAKNKRYDFYLPKTNQIFEVHGGFHINSTKYSNKYDVQNNDKIKRDVAKNNGIELYDEIVADITEYEFLKENYSQCLSKYFNLSNIDLILAWKTSQKSIMTEVCKYFNDNPKALFIDIAKQFKLNNNTVTRYIKEGNRIGLCEYSDSGINARNKIKVYVYDKDLKLVNICSSLIETTVFYDISKSTLKLSIKTGKPVEKLGLYFKDSEILS